MTGPAYRRIATMAVAVALAATGCTSGSANERASAPAPPVTAGPATPSAAPTPAPSPSGPPAPLAQLPLGGRTIFPAYRVVAYYGTAGNPVLGVLGEGTPE